MPRFVRSKDELKPGMKVVRYWRLAGLRSYKKTEVLTVLTEAMIESSGFPVVLVDGPNGRDYLFLRDIGLIALEGRELATKGLARYRKGVGWTGKDRVRIVAKPPYNEGRNRHANLTLPSKRW